MPAFAFALIIRPIICNMLVKKAPEAARTRKVFFVDLVLCCLAGLIINIYNTTVYGVPLTSVAALFMGCIITGFFIGLDSALAQERQLITSHSADLSRLSIPNRYYPLTKRFTLIAVVATLFTSLTLTLVFSQDIEWLTTVRLDSESIYQAKLSVIYEIFFIMGILTIYLVNLIFSYSRNLKMLFRNQTKVLEMVRHGDLSAKVPVATQDEFGVIAGHTNHMIDGLRHRFQLISSLDLAKEVQQSLLPRQSPLLRGYDIAGVSKYCEQTGGDYHDYLLLPDNRVGVVIADACGHGISAALLITSVRAFLNSTATSYDSPSRLLGAVNQHLSRDCASTSQFSTMFFLELTANREQIRWARAGHEPPLLYRHRNQSFARLTGNSLVLGIDGSYDYSTISNNTMEPGDILLLFTDGVSETTNSSGNPFGLERLQAVIREQAAKKAADITEAILASLATFRSDRPQEDDVTLVVVKRTGDSLSH